MKQKLPTFSAFVGIDWADKKHDLCVAAQDDDNPTYSIIDHTPEDLQSWVVELRKNYPHGQIAVALEQSKGALIYNLLGYEFLTLFPINPKSLARFRESFTPSGAKGDSTDAGFLWKYVVTFHKDLQPWEPADEHTRTIAFLAEGRRKVVNERTRLTSRLRSTLKMYFPQALDIIDGPLHSKLSLDFLNKWPSLNNIKKAQEQTVIKFFTTHNSRSKEKIDKRLTMLKEAIPLTHDQAVIKSSLMLVKLILKQIHDLNNALAEYDQELKKLYDSHPDKDIFDSFPGVGPALGPRLIAAWGTDRDRYDSAESMQKYAGVAPVTKASGKSKVTIRRVACPKFLLQTFHEFAGHSLEKSIWAKSFYDMMRERGKKHHTAIRALAFKWIRIMYVCWYQSVPYDEVKYIQALQRAKSPLLGYL
jgi:transposase